MVLDILQTVMIVVLYISCAAYIVLNVRRRQYVPGSHPRYVATTVMIGCGFAIMASEVVLGVINVLQYDYGLAGFDGAVALVWLWAIKRLFDDDNWFNDQWKRFKRSLKRLRQRLASLSPTPLPSPA